MDLNLYTEHHGLFFHPDTLPAVRSVLTRAYLNKKVVRIWYGDPATGKAFPDEFEVLGTVGRSTGPVKVPLLVLPGEDGGGQISAHVIVRIDFVETTKTDGPFPKVSQSLRNAFKHPSFNTGSWKTGSLDDSEVSVFHEGSIHARFPSALLAQLYISFMKGETAYIC
ncbi:hypothetical protein LC612_28300 [Nostoc sp. CHAB 5834]|nr:hypothetical protein [Nostoc sp. CHAB 5834]